MFTTLVPIGNSRFENSNLTLFDYHVVKLKVSFFVNLPPLRWFFFFFSSLSGLFHVRSKETRYYPTSLFYLIKFLECQVIFLIWRTCLLTLWVILHESHDPPDVHDVLLFVSSSLPKNPVTDNSTCLRHPLPRKVRFPRGLRQD